MSKRIFIDGNINSEICIIATDGQEVNYFDYSDELISSKKNNIYLGTVSRVEPSLQAAFIDFGSEKKAFLPFDEIHPSYFIWKITRCITFRCFFLHIPNQTNKYRNTQYQNYENVV